MRKKPFTAPVWILGIIVLIRIIFVIYVVTQYAHFYAKKNEGSQYSFLVSFIVPCIIILVVIAQIVVYWLYRFKAFKRVYAWLHLVLYAIAFVILPIITAVVPFLFDNFYGGSPMKFMRWVSTANFYIFWLCFIGGIVLMGLVIKTAKRSFLVDEMEVQSGDILSDL